MSSYNRYHNYQQQGEKGNAETINESASQHAMTTKGDEDPVECPRCGVPMASMQACHLICTNCGVHLDCSDKGNFW